MSIAVIGAGRIGLPWAAGLAVEGERQVTLIDVDESVVETISSGAAPFEEPQLAEYIEHGVSAGHLNATTAEDAVTGHDYLAFTINAARGRMDRFVGIVQQYLDRVEGSPTVISRTTLPTPVIDRVRQTVAAATGGESAFVVFPERLAEGRAIEEILTLPKIVGADDAAGEHAMRQLLAPFGGDVQVTDPETAMFVKLIDNAYRDGIFAIANQIAYIADELGLDAHAAIALANTDYPRNDIPTPGPVGGKCLPKDPHFLMDETIWDQPSTPDLFNATRRTNASIPQYVTTALLTKRPRQVALLGIAYKRDVGDTAGSPVVEIREGLLAQGVGVAVYDPHVDTGVNSLEAALDGADLIVYAINHSAFEGIEPAIETHAEPAATVYDVWGELDHAALDRPVDGLGQPGRAGAGVESQQQSARPRQATAGVHDGTQ